MTTPKPSRGEVWLIDFSPTSGHEPSGFRPGLVVSVDQFNHGLAGVVMVIPITSKPKGIPLHIEINPPEGGTKQRSFIKCEDLRSISVERLMEQWGTVTAATMREVEHRLRLLLSL